MGEAWAGVNLDVKFTLQIRRRGEGVMLEQPGENKEHLSFGKRLADADSTTEGEGHEAVGMLTNLACVVQEVFCG